MGQEGAIIMPRGSQTPPYHSNAASGPIETNSHPTPFIFDRALSLISALHQVCTED